MRVQAIDEAHAIGTTDHLLMCIWRTVTSPEAVAELQTIATRHARTAAPMGMITVVEDRAEHPSSEARNGIAELFQMLNGSVSCSALVFEGDGFRAAAVRGIVTSINLLAKQAFPHKVFARAADASIWMAQHDRNLPAPRIARSLADLREALDGRSGAAMRSPQP